MDSSYLIKKNDVQLISIQTEIKKLLNRETDEIFNKLTFFRIN